MLHSCYTTVTLIRRFLRVTHDDMSLKPVETAEKVYQFIGKKIPDSMSEFLLQHTSSHEKGDSFVI